MDYETGRTGLWQRTRTGEQIFPVNVFDSNHDLVVTAPLPGVEPEDIDVTVMGNTLTIRAELRGPGQERRDYLRHEWTYGPYVRQIELPYPVDAERASASFGNGVLALTLPKAASARSRRIELKATGTAR